MTKHTNAAIAERQSGKLNEIIGKSSQSSQKAAAPHPIFDPSAASRISTPNENTPKGKPATPRAVVWTKQRDNQREIYIFSTAIGDFRLERNRLKGCYVLSMPFIAGSGKTLPMESPETAAQHVSSFLSDVLADLTQG